MKPAQKSEEEWDSGSIERLDDSAPMSIREGLRRFRKISEECGKNVDALTQSINDAHAADRHHERSLERLESHLQRQDQAALKAEESAKWLRRYLIGMVVFVGTMIFAIGRTYSQIENNQQAIQEIRAVVKEQSLRDRELWLDKWPKIEALSVRLDALTQELRSRKD